MTNPRQPDEREVIVVGTNHRSGSMFLRDRIFVEDGALPAFLAEVAAQGLDECMVLSTCDRVEIHAAHEAPEIAVPLVQEVLVRRASLPREETLAQLYSLRGAPALRHVFAVVASLDSMVVGEPQILGQVRASHAAAIQAGTMGLVLEHTMQAAYAAAKRVRADTLIARGPVSMAASAVQVARDIHGDLGHCRCLLIGAGEMGELMLEQLRQAGLRHLTVAAVSESRAAATGRRHGCHAIALPALGQALPDADIVITDLASGRHLLDAATVNKAIIARRRRPQFIIDAAIPGDVDPAVALLDDVFLYDLDDLEGVAHEGRAGREASALAAWAIIDEALSAFERNRQERGAVPAMVRLQQHFESVRADILARPECVDAAEATRLLVNRLLHDPYAVLRRAAAEEETDSLARAAMHLFHLDDDTKEGME